MDLVHMATCSICWAILWSTESNKSSRWGLMDLVHMATCSIHWAILWSTESNKSSRWSLMDLIHMAACSMLYSLGYALFAGLYCGVLNPTKAASGVWWIWYTWLHALFTGLYCGVLNPTKAAGGVWWIWYTWLHICWAILWNTESIKIRQNQEQYLERLLIVFTRLLFILLCNCSKTSFIFSW